MKKVALAALIFLPAATLLANGNNTPLDIKTGLWEATTVGAMNGTMPIPPDMAAKLTPEQRAQYEAAMKGMAENAKKPKTSRNCVTADDLTKQPFTDENGKQKENCKSTVTKSTGSDMEVRQVCNDKDGQADIKISFHAVSSEHVTGTVHMVLSSNGQSMTSDSNIDAKWISGTCPADLKKK